MPFNGSGLFGRLYSWSADFANNLFISSDRMDAEFNGIAAGLSNCMTRDGQSPAVHDIPLGNNRITGLAPGVAATDAANLGQVTTTQWSADTSVAEFLSSLAVVVQGTTTTIISCSFKVKGADKTALYAPGRRFLVTDGSMYQQGTVVSSSFAAPDTTVNGTLDAGSGAALSSAINKSMYGFIDYATPGYLSQRTAVQASSNAGQLCGSGAPWRKVPMNIEIFDALGEYIPAGALFTPRYPGFFRVTGNLSFQALATGTTEFYVAVYKNGAQAATVFQESKSVIINSNYSFPFGSIVPLLALGDYMEIFCYTSMVSFNSGAASYLAIDRIV